MRNQPKSDDRNRIGPRIAYLAPEIPARSATFVYNEILALEDQGVTVVPVSVHAPADPAEEDHVLPLAQRTACLYGRSRRQLIGAHIALLTAAPWRYAKTLATALADVLHVGPFNRTGMGLLYRFGVSACLAVLLKREGCSHLHVHFAHIPTDLAMYAALLTGVPFSFTAHANDLFERAWLLKQKVRRAMFAITISEYNRRFLYDCGADVRKVHVVHCGVPSATFATRPFRKMRAPVRIGTIGRMVEKKGFDDLISTCRILKDRGFQFRLDLAGDGPLRDRLMKQAAALDLGGWIDFKGAMAHQAVPAWMQNLDLFVLPCKKDRHGDMDGIPVVLMEAMLTGVPVVSTHISGISELVQDGYTGCLASPNQPTVLAEAILRICRDDALAERLCRQAAERVRAQFDLADNTNRLLTLFKEKNHAISGQTLCDYITGA